MCVYLQAAMLNKLFKLTGETNLRGYMTPEGEFEASVLDFMTIVCKYADKTASTEWARIQKKAAEPGKRRDQRDECGLIVEGCPAALHCMFSTATHAEHGLVWQLLQKGR